MSPLFKSLSIAALAFSLFTFGFGENTNARADNLQPATSIQFEAPSAGIIYKQGGNGFVGTFVANGASGVNIANTNYSVTDTVAISLNTVGGTVGALPTIQIGTTGTGFQIKATASDTSTYNYSLFKNLP